jgi:hypothetical protein
MEISAVASKNPSVAILDISEINNIRRNMYVARRSTLPPMPRNIQDVHNALNTVLTKTVRNEEFLLVNDIDSNIIIFSRYTNLNFLCSVETWYMDGTFQYCAKYFYQLYTIHGYKNRHYYVPLVFALLPNKSSTTYAQIFQLISVKCVQWDLVLKPKTIIVDFEKAIHTASKMFSLPQ